MVGGQELLCLVSCLLRAIAACRMTVCPMSAGRHRYGMKESDVAEGTGTNGVIRWAPRASVQAARLDGGSYMHAEPKGTNGRGFLKGRDFFLLRTPLKDRP